MRAMRSDLGCVEEKRDMNESQRCVHCGRPTVHDIGSIPMHLECADQAQDPQRFREPYPPSPKGHTKSTPCGGGGGGDVQVVAPTETPIDLATHIALTISAQPNGMGLPYQKAVEIGNVLAPHLWSRRFAFVQLQAAAYKLEAAWQSGELHDFNDYMVMLGAALVQLRNGETDA